jgi:hypothetical protein
VARVEPIVFLESGIESLVPTVVNSAVVRENRPPQFDPPRVASMPPWNEALRQ